MPLIRPPPVETAARERGGSNCVFDDSRRAQQLELERPLMLHVEERELERDSESERGSSADSQLDSRPPLESVERGRMETTSAFALKPAFPAMQRGSSMLTDAGSDVGLPPTARRTPVSCSRRVRRCLRWKWSGPVAVTGLSLALGVLGALCLFDEVALFASCTETFLSLSALLPVAALLTVVVVSQPSERTRRAQGFYSDALLEEMLSGESLLELYTVTTRGATPREGNVVLFLAGVGGSPEGWRPHVEAVADAGFCVIQVQLPGAGCLSAVSFSLQRAALVVARVLEAEVLAGRPGQTGGRRVVLVAWGLSCHVAMLLASSQEMGRALAGLVCLGCPRVPIPRGLPGPSWLFRMKVGACRVPWIAELARLSEYASMAKHQRRVTSFSGLRPLCRSDWGDSFLASEQALVAACRDFRGPVLVIAGSAEYLRRAERLFAAAEPSGSGARQWRGEEGGEREGDDDDDDGMGEVSRGEDSDSLRMVDAVQIEGLAPANLVSFPPSADTELYARHIIDFALDIFI